MILSLNRHSLAETALGGSTGGSIASWSPAATGRIERAKALELFQELAGKSVHEIARIMKERRVATPTGKSWSAMTVIRVRDRLAA
jgi:hypothetical protein